VVSTLKRRNVVDPAVAEMLSDMEKKKRITSLPKPQQEKARKDAARHKVGLDLPPELHEALRRIADKEHISVSGLVTFYLYRGVVDHEAGNIELSPYKRLSRCARFEYILDFTKLEKP
jgi:hypothetical protein